jgi:hypothetical protein
MEWRVFGELVVSESGEVRSASERNHLSPRIDANGYVVYNFGGTRYYAHRLVAHLWLGLDLEDRSSQVDHIDNIRTNNHWSNLQIVSSGENKRLATLRAYPEDDGLNKTCRRCRVLKSVSEFGKDRKRSDGRTVYCKPCTKHYAHR